jgi:transposase
VDAQRKTPIARERDRPDVEAKRKAFLLAQAMLDPKRLRFIDESGFRLGSPPHYGWAPIGEKSPGKSTQGDWTTMTMIGAIGLDGFGGLMSIDAATDAEVFRAFVRHELARHLRKGDIVVMDNLSAHKDAEALRLIRSAGADVLYLPPYSPEYNPIEKAWSKIKEVLRRVDTLTRDAFEKALVVAMDAVSCADIRAWVEHAGYRVSQYDSGPTAVDA